MSKNKIDKLETFFISETTKLLGLYEKIKNSDPRDCGIIEPQNSLTEEAEYIKGMWNFLITYAKLYEYKRFEKVDVDLEKFYMEKINV